MGGDSYAQALLFHANWTNVIRVIPAVQQLVHPERSARSIWIRNQPMQSSIIGLTFYANQ